MACMWLRRHHDKRVKKLVTEAGNPSLIISAAEDGTGAQAQSLNNHSRNFCSPPLLQALETSSSIQCKMIPFVASSLAALHGQVMPIISALNF